MKMKRFPRVISWVLIIVLLTALLSGCGSTQYPERPAMWEVTGSDTENTLYLFGSIHAAEEDLYPLDDEIMDAFNASDALAVEVDILVYMENPLQAMELSSYLMYMDGGTITDEIDEELFLRTLDVLEAEGIDLGVPAEMAVMFRPYTLMSYLSDLSVERSGLSAEAGVDLHLLQLARDKNMEILEVETMESQMEMLTGFSPAVQTYLLEDSLDIDAAVEGLQELYAIWKSGDLDKLVGEDGDEDGLDLEVIEEYNQALLVDRNVHMTDVAEGYLQEDKTVFYVVGALHMVGEDGIVQLLTDRGYTVKRV